MSKSDNKKHGLQWFLLLLIIDCKRQHFSPLAVYPFGVAGRVSLTLYLSITSAESLMFKIHKSGLK